MTIERYFSVCTMSDCEVSDTSNVTFTTAGGATTYNSTRQAGAIRVTGAGGAVASFIETPPFVDAASTTSFFTVFNSSWNNSSTGPNGGVWWEAINSTGVVVLRCRTTGTSGSANVLEYWNGSTYTAIGVAFAHAINTLQRVHIAVVCGASGSATLKLGGIVRATGSISSASMNNIAKCRLYTTGSTGGELSYWGEWMGANFDLTDAVVRYDPPTGNSATNTAWTGAFGDVDEADRNDADLISSGSAGDRETYTHAAYTVPNGSELDSVWVCGRGRVNGAGPTDAKYSVRQSSTNYDSSALSLGAAFLAKQRYWATDPSTSAKFTNAGYNSVEFGAVSI